MFLGEFIQVKYGEIHHQNDYNDYPNVAVVESNFL